MIIYSVTQIYFLTYFVDNLHEERKKYTYIILKVYYNIHVYRPSLPSNTYSK